MKWSFDANWPSGGVHLDFFAVSVSKAPFFLCGQICRLCYGKML